MTGCNKCGKLFNALDLDLKCEYHKVLGYGSKHDGKTIDINLCGDCLDEELESMQKRFKHSPFISEEA